MWQSIVSIDSSYQREIKLLQKRFEEFDQLYFAKSETKSRVFYSIAGREDDFIASQCQLFSMIADIVVVNMKYNYFASLMKNYPMTNGLACVISALVSYEQMSEYDYVVKMLDKLYEYSIDGFLKFRLKGMLDDWEEIGNMLVSMMLTLPSETELFELAKYLMGNKNCGEAVFVTKQGEPLITTSRTKKILSIRELFDSSNFNIIQTLINFNPSEVIIDGKKIDDDIVSCIKNIYPIKII